MNSPATRFFIFPLCAALVAGTALCALSLPALADTTTKIITLPENAIPKTKKQKEEELKMACKTRSEPSTETHIPKGTTLPTAEECKRFEEEKDRRAKIERERAITTGHPVEPVKPLPPAQPIQ